MLRPLFLALLFVSIGACGQDIKITRFKSQNIDLVEIKAPIILNYKASHIIISYEDIASKGNANYELKLDGFDDDWVSVGSLSTYNYTNLFGGKYVFKVRNTQFKLNEASIEFEIEEAFWQRKWFVVSFVSYMFLIAGIIFFFFKNARLKQQNKMQGVRNEISSDLHDDVGSTLANISFLTEIAQIRLKENKKDDVELLLEKILEDSKLMVQTMRGLIWTIKPENDDAIDFFIKVKNLATDFLSPRNIELIFEQKISENLKLSLEIQRNLFLVFKESVHNIVKYAKATKVTIIVKEEGNWLMMLIKDNGVGFKDEEVGNGILNIKKRIEGLKGTVEFISNDEGLKIRIAVPLIK